MTTQIPNISFNDFCDFVRSSLRRYPRRYFSWSELDQKVLDRVIHGIEDFIQIEEHTDRDIGSLLQDFEKAFDLVVPIIWGAFSDVYFKNWFRKVQFYKENGFED